MIEHILIGRAGPLRLILLEEMSVIVLSLFLLCFIEHTLDLAKLHVDLDTSFQYIEEI